VYHDTSDNVDTALLLNSDNYINRRPASAEESLSIYISKSPVRCALTNNQHDLLVVTTDLLVVITARCYHSVALVSSGSAHWFVTICKVYLGTCCMLCASMIH
jgi:hypothetical protein